MFYIVTNNEYLECYVHNKQGARKKKAIFKKNKQ